MPLPVDQILEGHVLDVLKALPDESLDCVVTSPPYWGLRAYGTKPQVWGGDRSCEHSWGPQGVRHKGGPQGKSGQRANRDVSAQNAAQRVATGSLCECGAWLGEIGLEPTVGLYIDHMVSVFDEVSRVLKRRGSCWVNLGDTYSTRNGIGARWNTGKQLPISGGRRKLLSLSAVAESVPFDRPVRHKSLCLVPERFVIAMTDRGWIIRNEIVWHKPNIMPSSIKDRFTVDFEKLFFMVKQRRYYFEQQFEPQTGRTPERMKYSFGGRPGSAYPNEPRPNPFPKTWRFNPAGRNKRCVWRISTQPFADAHFAVFPPKLVATPIRAACPPGGIVLDPFVGSGTTAVVARQLGRHFIGIELNPEYAAMARKRIAAMDKPLSLISAREAP